ncbi:MAG: Hpt domain-containing protein [Pseudomonadota bacterium]
MSNHCVIDLEHLDKYVAGDLSLRDEILTIFSEQAAMLDEKFGRAATDEAWRNTAHSLKGASRGVGAWALGDLCEEAERLIANTPGKSDRRAAILESIRHQVELAIDEVRRLRALAA